MCLKGQAMPQQLGVSGRRQDAAARLGRSMPGRGSIKPSLGVGMGTYEGQQGGRVGGEGLLVP